MDNAIPSPRCARCNAPDPKLIYRCKDDNIHGLDHAEMECVNCGYHSNHWYEPPARLKEVFQGEDWEIYCRKTMFAK